MDSDSHEGRIEWLELEVETLKNTVATLEAAIGNPATGRQLERPGRTSNQN